MKALASHLRQVVDEIVARHAWLGSDAEPATPLAVGWATVELDRAAAGLERAIDGAGPFGAADPDVLLGAVCLSLIHI
jgi:hypothetical protein